MGRTRRHTSSFYHHGLMKSFGICFLLVSHMPKFVPRLWCGVLLRYCRECCPVLADGCPVCHGAHGVSGTAQRMLTARHAGTGTWCCRCEAVILHAAESGIVRSWLHRLALLTPEFKLHGFGTGAQVRMGAL